VKVSSLLSQALHGYNLHNDCTGWRLSLLICAPLYSILKRLDSWSHTHMLLNNDMLH
jgi:hypothetical protein